MSLLSDMVVAGFFGEESLCQFAEPIAEISRQVPGLPAFTPSSDGTLVYLEPGFYSDICLSSGISEMYSRFNVVGDIEKDTELPGSEFFERVEVREGRGYCFMMRGAYSMDDALTATNGNWFLLPQFQKNGQFTISVLPVMDGFRCWFFWRTEQSGLQSTRTVRSLKDFKRAIDRGTFHGNLLFHIQRSGQAVCVPSDRAFCHFTVLAEGAAGSLTLSLGMRGFNYLYTFFCCKKNLSSLVLGYFFCFVMRLLLKVYLICSLFRTEIPGKPANGFEVP